MEFNVAQLLRGVVGDDRSYRLDEEVEPILETGTRHVAGSLRLVRTGRSILGNVSLTADARATCSRCLEGYGCWLEIRLEEEWFPTVEVETGRRLALPEDNREGFAIDERHILSLREAVRQYAIMSMPMKPLCQEECPGICPRCGAQRKYEACRCEAAAGDARWGPLLDLLAERPG